MKNVFHLSELPTLDVPNDLFDVGFIHTDNITVAFNDLKAGAIVPEHEHVHETIDFVMEGTLEMVIAGEVHVMNAGTVARVPSNVRHGARAITPCRVINIFYPKREDFK